MRLQVLDGTDAASVAAAAEQVGQDPGRLDALVNNAGITSGLAPISRVQPADLRRTYETNVFDVVTVTNAQPEAPSMLAAVEEARGARHRLDGFGTVRRVAAR